MDSKNPMNLQKNKVKKLQKVNKGGDRSRLF